MTRDVPSTLPAITEASKEFWAQAQQRVLALPNCDDCGHRWFPPTANCPNCMSTHVSIKPSSGRARLWSWTVMHKQYFIDFPAPHMVAMVELEEGPMMTSSIVNVRSEDLRCDLPLRASFETFSNGTALIFFEPDS